jgi:hypothetical protein
VYNIYTLTAATVVVEDIVILFVLVFDSATIAARAGVGAIAASSIANMLAFDVVTAID